MSNVTFKSGTGGGGGVAVDRIAVQAATAPGTNPVLATVGGQITVNGSVVAAQAIPIRTNSLAANTFNVETQYASAVASTTANAVGFAAFSSSHFAVDGNGFVTLAGGGQAIDSIGTQTGTNPITPTSGGLVTINGGVVAAGTNPVRSNGTGANTMAMEVQISQAIAATDATKIGLANFDSTSFAVDANGFVTLLSTAMAWTDQGSSVSVTSNSGSFATASITLTLPASPSQGATCEFVVAGVFTLIIDAPGTQLIRQGNSVSSAGGTITSSGLAGDSIVLVYRSSDTTWYSVGGPQGFWTTA